MITGGWEKKRTNMNNEVKEENRKKRIKKKV